MILSIVDGDKNRFCVNETNIKGSLGREKERKKSFLFRSLYTHFSKKKEL